jgi:hypothetical protein
MDASAEGAEGNDAGVGSETDAPHQPLCFEPQVEADAWLEILQEDACAVWNSLRTLSGALLLRRDGDVLSIDFGEGVVFSGTVSGVDANLAYAHEHEFEDGCRWVATETLTGPIDPISCGLLLTYSYEEAVVEDRGACYLPCSADADIHLEIIPFI